MSYSVQSSLNDLSGVIHGTTINKVPNIYGVLTRAARDLLLDVDPKETIRIVALSQVFNSVFDYAIPSDVKGDGIVDLRPQAGRTPNDVFVQDYSQTFDKYKNLGYSNAIQTQWNTGVKTLRIEAPTIIAPTVICDTSTITGWSASGGATTPILDTTFNVAGGGDLKFNLSAGQATGYLENSTLQSLDLSAVENISTLFLWVYMPTGASITSVDVRWGSSSANYYNYTTTATQQGTVFQNGWNLLQFPWVSATKTGTLVTTAINYLRVTFAYNSTLQTGMKICNLTSNPGMIMELEFYSKFLFRDPTTNVFQETVVDINDSNKLINLDTDSYGLYFDKCAHYVAQSLQGADAEYDVAYWEGLYENALIRYKGKNPSERMIKGEFYMKMPRKSYTRFNPGFWRR